MKNLLSIFQKRLWPSLLRFKRRILWSRLLGFVQYGRIENSSRRTIYDQKTEKQRSRPAAFKNSVSGVYEIVIENAYFIKLKLRVNNRQVVILDKDEVKINAKIKSTYEEKLGDEDIRGSEKRGTLLQYYAETGMMKVEAIK